MLFFKQWLCVPSNLSVCMQNDCTEPAAWAQEDSKVWGIQLGKGKTECCPNEHY